MVAEVKDWVVTLNDKVDEQEFLQSLSHLQEPLSKDNRMRDSYYPLTSIPLEKACIESPETELCQKDRDEDGFLPGEDCDDRDSTMAPTTYALLDHGGYWFSNAHSGRLPLRIQRRLYLPGIATPQPIHLHQIYRQPPKGFS